MKLVSAESWPKPGWKPPAFKIGDHYFAEDMPDPRLILTFLRDDDVTIRTSTTLTQMLQYENQSL